MPDGVGKARKVRVYSGAATLAKLDQRTREARLMREVRAELTAHCGGQPSQTQRMMIERAAQLALRVATMDRKFAETGVQTEHDSRTYLAWCGSFTRLLKDLGPAVTTDPLRSRLRDYLDGGAAS